MQLQPVFDLSDKIIAGLVSCDLVRRGGVLHQAAATGNGAGRVVAWLRETKHVPTAPVSLSPNRNGVGNLLGLVGSVPSVLTVGATVGFGVATLRKLAQIENRLQVLDGKIDRLQWTIEVGFANALYGLEQIAIAQEFEIVANVKSAARLAWEAQSLEPGGPQRVARLENSLMLATQASEQLILRTQHEMEAAIEWMKSRASESFRIGWLQWLNQARESSRLDMPDSVTGAIRRFRQTCLASAVRAAIQAETASPNGAACGLEEDVSRLQPLIARLTHVFLRGCEPGETSKGSAYPALVKCHCFPVARIDLWAKRFDPQTGGATGVLELVRQADTSGLLTRGGQLKEELEKEKAERMRPRKNLVDFGDGLDGAWEDIDRLAGYVLEYRTAGQAGLSIHSYRESLTLPDCPMDRALVFFWPKEDG